MRIVIVGTQCTGKTSLINSIKASSFRQYDYTVLSEVVRGMSKRLDVKINKEFEFLSQDFIFTQHRINAMTYKNMVSDRGCIDALAYTIYNKRQGLIKDTEYDIFEKSFKETLPYYDLVFYLPIEFPLISDNFRSTDEQFRIDIDKIFKEIFDLYKIKYVTLSGFLEERLVTFLTNFENEKNKRNI